MAAHPGEPASRHARGRPRRRVMRGALALAVLAGVGALGGGTLAGGRHGARGATSSAVPDASAQTSSIAVLPFENVSGAREHEYFADGITRKKFHGAGHRAQPARLAQVGDALPGLRRRVHARLLASWAPRICWRAASSARRTGCGLG